MWHRSIPLQSQEHILKGATQRIRPCFLLLSDSLARLLLFGCLAFQHFLHGQILDVQYMYSLPFSADGPSIDAVEGEGMIHPKGGQTSIASEHFTDVWKKAACLALRRSCPSVWWSSLICPVFCSVDDEGMASRKGPCAELGHMTVSVWAHS